MQLKDVEKLADLARIKMGQEEKEEILKDLQGILGYVGQINQVNQVNQARPYRTEFGPFGRVNQATKHVNIIREDIDPHQTGIYTAKILAEAQQKQDGYIKVQKIL